jgi:hypothetical protein
MDTYLVLFVRGVIKDRPDLFRAARGKLDEMYPLPEARLAAAENPEQDRWGWFRWYDNAPFEDRKMNAAVLTLAVLDAHDAGAEINPRVAANLLACLGVLVQEACPASVEV